MNQQQQPRQRIPVGVPLLGQQGGQQRMTPEQQAAVKENQRRQAVMTMAGAMMIEHWATSGGDLDDAYDDGMFWLGVATRFYDAVYAYDWDADRVPEGNNPEGDS